MTAGRKSSVRQGFEQRVLLPLAKVFANRRKGEQSQPVYRTVTKVNDEPVDSLMTVGIFATAVVMLITPLWILATIGETTQKLKVITVFLVVFLAVLNWGTLARPFEILVATAGYECHRHDVLRVIYLLVVCVAQILGGVGCLPATWDFATRVMIRRFVIWVAATYSTSYLLHEGSSYSQKKFGISCGLCETQSKCGLCLILAVIPT